MAHRRAEALNRTAYDRNDSVRLDVAAAPLSCSSQRESPPTSVLAGTHQEDVSSAHERSEMQEQAHPGKCAQEHSQAVATETTYWIRTPQLRQDPFFMQYLARRFPPVLMRMHKDQLCEERTGITALESFAVGKLLHQDPETSRYIKTQVASYLLVSAQTEQRRNRRVRRRSPWERVDLRARSLPHEERSLTVLPNSMASLGEAIDAVLAMLSDYSKQQDPGERGGA